MCIPLLKETLAIRTFILVQLAVLSEKFSLGINQFKIAMLMALIILLFFFTFFPKKNYWGKTTKHLQYNVNSTICSELISQNIWQLKLNCLVTFKNLLCHSRPEYTPTYTKCLPIRPPSRKAWETFPAFLHWKIIVRVLDCHETRHIHILQTISALRWPSLYSYILKNVVKIFSFCASEPIWYSNSLKH